MKNDKGIYDDAEIGDFNNPSVLVEFSGSK